MSEHESGAPPLLVADPVGRTGSSRGRAAWARRLALIVAVTLAAFAAVRIRRGMGTETTDDAHLEAATVDATAMVSGRIGSVLVRNDAIVEANAVLMTIEDEGFKIALARAEAEVRAADALRAQADARLRASTDNGKLGVVTAQGEELGAAAAKSSLDADLADGRAQLEAARSQLNLAEREYARALAIAGSIPAAQLEAQRALLERATADARRAEARLGGFEARGAATESARRVARERSRVASQGNDRGQAEAEVLVATARLEQAEASRDLARMDLARTKVTAPFRGRVRLHVEPGAFTGVGTSLASIFSTEHVWVEARFKEKQVAHLATDQRASVVIDAFGGKVFSGRIDGIAGATASRFAAAPLEGTSASFVRVSQRVAVRIVLDDVPPQAYAGLSATVTVETAGAAP